jgi:hypothetical protein
VHQKTYFAKVLKHFYMEKAHQLSTPMIVRSLDVKKDHSIPREEDEEILDPEVPYLIVLDIWLLASFC